jgi:GNAT superfamily N-acetyltransferase
MSDDTPFIIQKFNKALHDRSAFSCGHGPIDNFLKSSLSDQVKAGMAVAYMATKETDTAVLGFYTLGAMVVRSGLGPTKWKRARVSEIPVIYIRAVAVDKKLQGNGVGTALMIDALKKCAGISGQVGAAAVVLDVLDDEHFEKRWKFYEGLGFHHLNDSDNPKRVFISMSDIRTTLKV